MKLGSFHRAECSNVSMLRKTLLAIVFLFVVLLAFAQKEIHVSGVAGKAFIYADVSPNQAKKVALNEAKTNALRKAGIEESIASYQDLFSSESGEKFDQYFNSAIQTEINGVLKSYEIVNDTMYCVSKSQIVYEVIIDACVIKYDTKPDAQFSASVTGLKTAYMNGDKLSFNLEVTRDCYLTIFNMADSSVSVLFPNNYEERILLKSKQTYEFPFKNGIKYPLRTKSKIESNRLIFVFTKKELPLIKLMKKEDLKMEDIFEFIYSISPDMRYVENVAFTLINNE